MNTILYGDVRQSLKTFAAFGVRAQVCITSPPYFGLRGYGDHAAELGKEETPEEFVANLVGVFRLVRDVLADDGVAFLNLGDSAGKNKQILGIPWRVAFALQADGWILRQEIIWAKAESGDAREGRCMPESVRDRFTKAHEQIFLLSKQPSYYFDVDAVKEPAQDWGKPRDRTAMRGGTDDPKLKHGGLSKANHPMGNRRSVWRVNPGGFKGAHFAVFPAALVEPCVLSGSRPGDIVLDPFMGSGTVAGVALKHGRQYIGCELYREYEPLQAQRIAQIVSSKT